MGALYEVTAVDGIEGDYIHMTVKSEDTGDEVEVKSVVHYFLGRGDELKRNYQIKKEAEEFDFGYVLTCHKSQGSQWNKVCVF